MKAIKDKIATYNLNKLAKLNAKRTKTFVNLKSAITIGVIFDATDSNDFELVKKFVAELKSQNKNVRAIGFFNVKILPTHLNYPKTEFDFFTAKELKGMNEPASPYIKTFIEDKKDLLIDLNIKSLIPLRHIAVKSAAICKCGLALNENYDSHDIFIEDETPSISSLIENLKKYLEMV